MGYASWAAYVDGEFTITRRQSYNLIDLGRAMRLLAQEVGRPVAVTIRQAKLLKAEPQRVQHVAHLIESGTSDAEAVSAAVRALPVRAVGREQVEWADECSRDEQMPATCPRCGFVLA
jgi:hypothetical protein